MKTTYDIDLEIKRLKEKKKQLQQKNEQSIGKFLIKEWGVGSLTYNEIIQLIKENNPGVKVNE